LRDRKKTKTERIKIRSVFSLASYPSCANRKVFQTIRNVTASPRFQARTTKQRPSSYITVGLSVAWVESPSLFEGCSTPITSCAGSGFAAGGASVTTGWLVSEAAFAIAFGAVSGRLASEVSSALGFVATTALGLATGFAFATGLTATGFRAAGLAAADFGAAGLAAIDFGAAGLEATGFDAAVFAVTDFGIAGLATADFAIGGLATADSGGMATVPIGFEAFDSFDCSFVTFASAFASFFFAFVSFAASFFFFIRRS
jgi:hypothetical protein